MLKRALLFVVLMTAAPAWSFAQSGFADLIDHIHLAAPDQAKAVEWYHTHFNAELTPEGTDRAMLGTTRLIFQKSESPKPSTGSILGLIGFSVPDVDGTVKQLQGAGVKVVMPAMTMYGVKMAQVVDPWGTLIDVVQDSKKTVCITSDWSRAIQPRRSRGLPRRSVARLRNSTAAPTGSTSAASGSPLERVPVSRARGIRLTTSASARSTSINQWRR
jgi:predicted enzyme related to lactoylglutathione lyase